MFTNLLVGVDGRQGGRDAIALARRLASNGASMTLANIYGSGWLLPRGIEVVAELERGESQRMLEAQRQAFGIDAQLSSRWHCSPGRGLHELAERHGSDLIVVGSSRRALLGRAMVGDDTRAALNGAPCAIAIAPRGYVDTEHEFKIIGVGYDGSSEAKAALAAARELAHPNGAAIKALWVVSLQDVRDDSPLPADWPQAADDLVESCQQQLDKLAGVDGEATYGGPKEALSRLGDTVDLLIIGSRRYGPVHRLFHGTTSTYLTRHIGCPILQLPRAGWGRAPEGTEQQLHSAVATSA